MTDDIAAEVCTEKEREVLRLVASGWSTRRISLALNISTSSVRGRLENARRKIAWATRKAADADQDSAHTR